MEALHWNSTQSRAQAMKEDLKNRDLNHLHSFLQGISDPEPPQYRLVNGKVEPQLEKVILKPGASTFQVGNVIRAEDSTIRYLYFTVDKGEVEVFETDALPKDPMNPLSIAIPDAVLLDLYPLLDAKFKAIRQRLIQVNDVRSYAHNAPNISVQRLSCGKKLSELMSGQFVRNGDDVTVNGAKTRKRISGEPVLRHPCNKRQKLGLGSIPDRMKMDALKTVPDQVAIDLFNTMAKATFPTFDNLIMAAWNVVCVYECVGTEFPGFHTAIVELKSVLQEFDVIHRKKISDARNEQVNDPWQNNLKEESPALATGSVPSHEQQQTTNSHNPPLEQHVSTVETNAADCPAKSAPVQLPDLTDSMTMDGNYSPEPDREGQNMQSNPSQTETKSSENFGHPKGPKLPQSYQKQKGQSSGQTSEPSDELKKKLAYLAQLKDKSRQIYELISSVDQRQLPQANRTQFKTEPTQSSSLEQQNNSYPSSIKQNDRDKLLTENSHCKGNNWKPRPIGPKPAKQVRTTKEMDS